MQKPCEIGLIRDRDAKGYSFDYYDSSRSHHPVKDFTFGFVTFFRMQRDDVDFVCRIIADACGYIIVITRQCG